MPKVRKRTGTFWSRTFDEARKSNSWVIVPRTYSWRTAKQLTYDIRGIHRQPVPKVAGAKPGERWDAIYDIPSSPDSEWNCTVAIKLLEKVD